MPAPQHRDFTFSLEDAGFTNPQTGRNFLIAIGIDAYQDETIPNLRNAEHDATQMTEVLTKRYEFDKNNTRILLNEKATRENIMEELDGLSDQITDEDNLLFYFSGHGYFRKKGTHGIGYLVPSDAKTGHYSTLLPNSTLLDYLSLIDAKHILLVVDSCYSGSLITKMRDVPSFSKQREGIAKYANRVGKLRSRMGLAAGRIETVADGLGKHSPFTTSLLGVLENNTLTDFPSSELFQKVKTNTTLKADQTPIAGVLAKGLHDGGEFVFQLRPDEPQDWEKAKAEDSIKSYEIFLQLYPEGKYVEEAFWRLAICKDNRSGYRQYMRQFPGGTYCREAIASLARVEERESFDRAKRRGESALRAFLLDYPNGQYGTQAQEEIERIMNAEQEPEAWQAALRGGEKELQAYLDQFPNGKNAASARSKIQRLYKEEEAKMEAEAQARMQKGTKPIEKSASIEKKKEQKKKIRIGQKPESRINKERVSQQEPVPQGLMSAPVASPSLQAEDLQVAKWFKPLTIVFITVHVLGIIYGLSVLLYGGYPETGVPICLIFTSGMITSIKLLKQQKTSFPLAMFNLIVFSMVEIAVLDDLLFLEIIPILLCLMAYTANSKNWLMENKEKVRQVAV